MTFKGMLKILVNDYRKQFDKEMFVVSDELVRTRTELQDVKEQLRTLQLGGTPPPTGISNVPVPMINLFVQYNGFFNQLCDIRQTITIRELLVKLRQITGISIDLPIRVRVLSENGLTTLFFLHEELDRTLESYDDCLKARMILAIEDDDEITSRQNYLQRSKSITSSERTYSYESDV